MRSDRRGGQHEERSNEALANTPKHHSNGTLSLYLSLIAVAFSSQMGEDLLLEVNPQIRFLDLANKIKDVKDIPLSRMRFLLPPAREVKKEKWEKNLRQVGVYNNGTLKLEPTTPCCWQWEPIEYYWSQTVAKLVEAIDPKEGTAYGDLVEAVPLPPPMTGTKLAAFMRKYPDIFHLETRTRSSDDMWVKINAERELPTWV